GREDSRGNLLAFDMGGTTAKLSLVDGGEPLTAYAFEAARQKRFMEGSGLPIRISTIELIEIGAGGGSIASVDEIGLLKVGPRSAGSHPGPASYGLGGTEPTVTDADFLLGYLNPDYFAGGEVRVDMAAARAALERLAGRVRLSPTDVAWGIHDVVNENMASAARVHIAERGRDPRDYALLCTGGAGPVHAWGVAHKLGLRQVICPPAAGGFLGQGFDLVVDLPDGPYGDGEASRERLTAAFETAYREKFALTPPDVPIEFINIRVAVRAPVSETAMGESEGGLPLGQTTGQSISEGAETGMALPLARHTDVEPGTAVTGTRAAYFRESHGFVESTAYARGRALAQNSGSIPSFIGTLPATVRHFIRELGAESMKPRDVLITNDAWLGTGHMSDVSVLKPIFHRDRLVAFSATTSHMPDIGGRIRAIEAREIFEEGLHIPLARLVRDGRVDDTMVALIRANVRTPDQTMGDIWAQVSANELMERRVRALMDDYGLDNLEALGDELFSRSERAMREAIRAVPDGTYRYGFSTDGTGMPFEFKIALTVRGDEIVADYTGSSPHQPRAIN